MDTTKPPTFTFLRDSGHHDRYEHYRCDRCNAEFTVDLRKHDHCIVVDGAYKLRCPNCGAIEP